ncbi:MAG: hypothetical protein QGG36_14125 [Pirellulaceae bacterium]|jgi:hypothetical protein|nr:hypothetical protein [Pirellulaceae bacterium]
MLNRRDYLRLSAAASAGVLPTAARADDKPPRAKNIAAIITVYRKLSHADVLIGKILAGWRQDGGAGPALKLASMYVDQFPKDDMSRDLARRYRVPIFDSIEKAITLGGDTIPVDGVISVGEHGNYPYNKKGQHLYPRRRFFKGITDTFRKYGRVVPVFNDKHLGPQWRDAQWMYRQAQELKFPFMAGSSLPVSFRTPRIEVPMGSELEAAVGIGYSGLDIYGAHALDSYQCLVERRKNAERGVKWVQCLRGEQIWNAVDRGVVRRGLLDAAYSVVPKVDHPQLGKIPLREDKHAVLFLFEYLDGFMGAQFMLQSVGRTSVAVKIKGQTSPLATQFEERAEPTHPHFAYLLKGIERMMHTGRPSYPVERTYLTSGILDRAITSRTLDGEKLVTPELHIGYDPVDYPHAPRPNLHSNPTQPPPG